MQDGKKEAVAVHMIVCQVHEKIGLSPGKFTRCRLIINDIIKAKNKAIARTREARKRRLKLKLERGKKSSSAELREGTTYQPGIDLSESDAVDVEAIPPPCYPPVEKPPLAKGAYVYFDLEATGLERDSHITQIAALDEESDECFCSYIIPKKPISFQASRVTGLRIKENTMYHNGMPVPAESIHEVLRGFISFLDNLPSDQQKILVGHNIKSYDCLVLMHALRSCGMVDDFHQQVIGYMETRKLFRLSFPSQKSFSQINLSRALLGENFTYAAHDAMEDVRTLKKLVLLPSVSSSDKELCEFSTTYITESINHNTRVKANLPTLQVLINQKVLTAAMARKIAGSNLTFHHLEVVFRRNGQEGLLTLLSETVSGRVRVSKSKKLITSLCDYFSK
ncbi:uncharacterized protein LOC133186204 [Saccostrea echinata]|uniref:uncharacterized protein LOC133186204 n=1 Tax=Saccostrea echinata TaxID=191078 RepID=UPI002A7EA62C|nr:uncharacterized protein LOC133186204 [Saccostrea echinata]